MKTKFEMLEISMDDLYDFLKDADYKKYCKARTWACSKLEEKGCHMTKEYFAVFWNRLICKLEREYEYTKPRSVDKRADYQRAYRQKQRERDALRLRRIRADEAHKTMIRNIPKETTDIQEDNLESLEELENRIGYLALGEDLKT